MASSHPDVHDFGNLPEIDEQADEYADLDDEIGLVVQDIEQHYQRLEHPEYDGAHRQALERLAAVPELDICRESEMRDTRTHKSQSINTRIYISIYLPFLKAKNSKMLWTMETTMVRPRRYGLVSSRATCSGNKQAY